MSEIILVAILIGIVAFFIGFFVNRKKSGKLDEFERLLRNTQEVYQRELSSLRSDIQEHLKSSREVHDKSSLMMHDQVRNFTKSISGMHHALEKVFESVKTSTDKMSSFQDIFKTPKLRGTWGETSLEYLLGQRYPKDLIIKQKRFSNGEKVDIALKLPNDLLLPVDAKFPMEIYKAYHEERDESLKRQKLNIFVAGVKKQIDDIESKYIRPEEGTVDVALMFIPAEAVYYEIMFNIPNAQLEKYAHKKRVMITSPNTISLYLQIIEHWYKDLTIQKETRELLKRLGTISIDAQKLDMSFGKLGKHLHDAQGSFDDSKKRLSLLSDRVDKVIFIGEETKELEQK